MTTREIVGQCANPDCPESDPNVYRVAGTVYGKRVVVVNGEGPSQYLGYFHLNCEPPE